MMVTWWTTTTSFQKTMNSDKISNVISLYTFVWHYCLSLYVLKVEVYIVHFDHSILRLFNPIWEANFSFFSLYNFRHLHFFPRSHSPFPPWPWIIFIIILMENYYYHDQEEPLNQVYDFVFDRFRSIRWEYCVSKNSCSFMYTYRVYYKNWTILLGHTVE